MYEGSLVQPNRRDVSKDIYNSVDHVNESA